MIKCLQIEGDSTKGRVWSESKNYKIFLSYKTFAKKQMVVPIKNKYWKIQQLIRKKVLVNQYAAESQHNFLLDGNIEEKMRH